MSLEGKQLGRYRLLNLIGSGNMGEVYLADDVQLHRQVAIKVTRAEATSYPDTEAIREATRLFQREARAVALLDHPHILPLFDYGEENVNGATLTYMVMPLRQEGSLASWLQKRGGSALLSPQEVVYFIRQAADALQHAHDHQITHQDIKPSNFLIRSKKEDPEHPDLLLADFGVAKFTMATTGTSRTIRGTPAYMAPEQWEGHTSPATDQYGLAVMAYELLTGCVPFQGSMGQVMYQHFQVPPRPPSQLNPRLSPQVDEVLLRALAKHAEDRFASVAAFARALQLALLEDDASTIIRTPPPPTPAPTLLSAPLEARVSHSTGTIPTAFMPPTTVDGRHARSFPKGMIMLLVTLALLVGAGSTAIFFFASAKQSSLPQTSTPAQGNTPSINQTDIATTAQVNANGTVQANANATAQANANATAQANIAATAQANANATAQASANATAAAQAPTSGNPYTSGGTLVLNDSLTANNKGYRWDEGTNNNNATCQFTGSGLDVTQPKAGYFHGCIAKSTDFSNFIYEVQMTTISGDYAGIIFCADTTRGTYYFFYLTLDGRYGLKIYGNGPDTGRVVKSGSNSAIQTGSGAFNIIAVVVRNGTIDFYVNQRQLDSIYDNSYSHGQIGVFAGNDGHAAEARFSNARVWAL